MSRTLHMNLCGHLAMQFQILNLDCYLAMFQNLLSMYQALSVSCSCIGNIWNVELMHWVADFLELNRKCGLLLRMHRVQAA